MKKQESMNKLEFLDTMERHRQLFDEGELSLKQVLLERIIDTVYSEDCSEKCLSTLSTLGTAILYDTKDSPVYLNLRSELVLKSILEDLGF